MPPFSCVLVGNESLLVECAKVLTGRGHHIATIASRNAEVIAWATGAGIPVVAPGKGIADRISAEFDWLLSIANLSVLPGALIARARKGAVNFHDGPLPRYAGLNAPVWALLNGEARHGITWHRIEGGVDEGRVLAQRLFDIGPDDTAFSLNARCYGAAIETFPAVVEALERDEPGQAQDLTQRSVCRRDDRPQRAGRLDFSRPVTEVLRLVRALDHGGYWNPLALPKIETAKGVYAVASAKRVDASGTPGTVLETGDTLVVACADGAVRLGLTCLAGLPVHDVAPLGEGLAPAPDSLTPAMAGIAAGDGYWRAALNGFAAADLAARSGGQGLATRALPGVSAQRAVAIIAAYAPGGWAYRGAATEAAQATAPGYIAGWLPMTPQGETLAALEADVAAFSATAVSKPAYARDLIGRDPALSPLAVPALGLSETGTRIDGTALCVVAGPQGVSLCADLSRVDEGTLDLFAARIAHLAKAEGPIAELDLLSAPERQILDRLNDTARAFDNQTINRLFEAQVARTPDAVALVFEGVSLTYAQMNARANRVAHVLQAMGIGPDTPVALCARRSPDLLIGALGILKAGGAYVPMDPAYPAERLQHFLTDSGAPVIVTQSALIDILPAHAADLLVLDTDTRLNAASEDNPATGAAPQDLAYLIYTSGSTGKPKGVMVEHRNVANFFAGMDDRIPHDPAGVWLAVTSLSFDISVLELFWTLARGFKLVLTSDEDRMMVSGGSMPVSDQKMDFSLFYWGNDDGPGPQKYELLLEGAKFADTHGFKAVWTPERHFHAFGGPYPNPAVTGAAVAAVTRNIDVRSGSCVAPLHHPVRIAEEWAVIDNLTNGRAGLGIASGWHPVDFVLRPENSVPNNKAAMFDTIDKIRRLWRGDAVDFDHNGETRAIQSLPRPVSRELPLWLTIAGNPDTWREAGEIGAHVLTHLLGQSIDEVAGKIRIYHEALRTAGHDPRDFSVTLMLHTYVARTRELARETARGPMKSYLLSAAGLVKQYAWAFPAFKKPKGVSNPMDIDLRTLSQDEVDGILEYAFNRYFEDSGLFGTVEDCQRRVEQLKRIGVTEIGCLIDYGIPTAQVLEGLYPLAEVLRRSNAPAQLAPDDFSLAAQIQRHGVTHLQCTPSMARMLVGNDEARAALSRVKQILIGGEALPGALAADLAQITGAPVQNMYGPTETTIWSTTALSRGGEGVVGIGTPIANTALHVLDEARRPVPIGAEGELWIGGAGVTRGYWQRADLTADRFVQIGGARLYRTGDLVRLRADGGIDFLGRADHQVKLRGYRIELGEIETALDAQPGVTQSVVIAREDQPGDVRLVAYVLGSADTAALKAALARTLPAHMVPAHVVRLDRFPLTPNKKIDRKALPAPMLVRPAVIEAPVAANGGDTMVRIAGIWRHVLGVAEVKPGDNFFQLGGHSLLAVQAHREIREALALPGLSITDVFRFPVLSALASHIDAKLKPAGPKPVAEAPVEAEAEAARGRLDAMSRRRAMRAERLSKLG
ncbi:MAG: LLM class flavin-dependent oxidoreductase [Rhodobacter sp.]|uniref:MupA/Atu3671 family FMN-dependent luciferase-like monooxygenase n=1 Tax=Pararhodobacter sp. TaxID=2127056 RepID=UPI002B5722F3|nr:MupA/Atu3671 family FMN-dependent luciferase-like monooxygenase [Pararhodobacter sp.]MCC0072356.1 LLM class flavin-dependent oxidoreductase [Rhodobacter sp.]HPD91887.1 LLM class flavin-dependent oxidoreductase [Pararhodobacter sp.]